MLYLDTARLGRMAPGAQEAHRHFIRLAGEEAGSLYFEQFLRCGAEVWPEELRRRYAGLAAWRGVAALKQSLRHLAGVLPDLPLLLAARSAQLMKFAARLLFHPCANVLVTDTGWPSYHAILERERGPRGRLITQVSIRDAILREQATEEDIVARISSAYFRHHCDGLFLTAVSNEGIRLPVERTVREVQCRRQPRLVVVDGAQDFCHVYPDLRHECCDLYLAGCHKWLGGYYPLGLGFYGRRGSRSLIERVLDRMVADGDLDDPLLRFIAQLERTTLDGYTETVNLAPLFSCRGALADTDRPSPEAALSFRQRLANARRVVEVSRGTAWRALLPDASFRSGILLLQSERADVCQAPPEAMRAAFHNQGLALTAYHEGLIRLSMPALPWHDDELQRIQNALAKAA
ncbi:MAG: aminotransferase class V-fold PLP-dependent enzyme [Gemmataceae bacterium]|nr:aminotransferase class V-fold PLP-dependent enzyme [Gemmataceae bacterium]